MKPFRPTTPTKRPRIPGELPEVFHKRTYDADLSFVQAPKVDHAGNHFTFVHNHSPGMMIIADAHGTHYSMTRKPEPKPATTPKHKKETHT